MVLLCKMLDEEIYSPMKLESAEVESVSIVVGVACVGGGACVGGIACDDVVASFVDFVEDATDLVVLAFLVDYLYLRRVASTSSATPARLLFRRLHSWHLFRSLSLILF